MGQQHLRHRPFEEALPQPDQLCLTQRRQCLPCRHRRPGFQRARHDRPTSGDRAGGYDHHFTPGQDIG